MADATTYPILKGLDDRNLDIDQALENNVSKPIVSPDEGFKGLYFPQVGDPADRKKSDVEKSDDFVQSLKSTSGDVSARPDIGDYTKVPETDVPWGTEKRYPGKYYLGQSNEDIYHNQQGVGEAFVKSVANMVPHFTHTLMESVVGPLAGVGYLLNGTKDQGFIDNPFTKWMETWGQGYNIYESSARKNANWWSPTYWGSMNSLNSVLGTVGDLAAFYVTGLGVGKLVGGATGGIAKMLGKSYDMSIQEIGKLATVLPEGAEGKAAVDELSSALTDIKNSGMGEAAKSDKAYNLLVKTNERYANQIKNFNKFQQSAVGVVTNMGMAQSSAHQTGESMSINTITTSSYRVGIRNNGTFDIAAAAS